MSIFNPNPDKPANIIDTTLLNNYAYVEPSRNTEFGEIDPKNNQILRYNINEQSEAETSNNTTNIRITESELAIRNRGFNYFKGKFNPGFPTSNVYTFCKPELSIVFKNGAYQYTRKISDPRSIRHGAGDGAYPPKVSIQRVYDSVQQNQYGKEFTGDPVCCPEFYGYNQVTKKCDLIYCCYLIEDEFVCKPAIEMGFFGEHCQVGSCDEQYCS
jgi:hypothetical protein